MYHYDPTNALTRRRLGLHCRDGKGVLKTVLMIAYQGNDTFGMSRLLGFGGCLLGAAVCFFVAFLTLPLLAIRPAKFALAFRHVVPSIKS
jgi:hypothetical protein